MLVKQIFTIDFLMAIIAFYGVSLWYIEIKWSILKSYYKKKHKERLVTFSSSNYEAYLIGSASIIGEGFKILHKGESISGDYRIMFLAPKHYIIDKESDLI